MKKDFYKKFYEVTHMAEPKIIEVQEHIIEMDGIRYHLFDASTGESRPDARKHQSWCWCCDGNELAPRDDEDRYKIFDHYCSGHDKTLRCDPDRAIVYRRIEA